MLPPSTQDASDADRALSLGGMLALLAAAIATFPGFGLLGPGPGEDADAFLVVQRGVAFAGEVLPSRSWGFPLYETIAYRVIHGAGVSWALALSYAWALVAAAFVGLAVRALGRGRASSLWAAAMFAALPISWIGANTALETSQGIALLAIALWGFARVCTRPGASVAATLFPFAAAGLAGATRPDHLLVAFALAVALASRRSRRDVGLAIAGLALSGAIALGVFLLVYGPGHFEAVRANVTAPEPWKPRLVKTAIGVVAAFGIPFWLVSPWLARRVSLARVTAEARRPLAVLVVVTTLLYALRMVVLPDEVEYLFPWVLVVLFALAATAPVRWLPAVTLALAIPLAVQVHLFARTPEGAISVRPGLSPGVVVQERERRGVHAFARDVLVPKANALALERGCGPAALSFDEYLFEDFPFVPAKPCALTSARRLAQLASTPGWEADASRFRWVFVHALPTDRGWRRLLATPERAALANPTLEARHFP